MNLKIRIERPMREAAPRKTAQQPEQQPAKRQPAPVRRPFLSSLEDFADTRKVEALKNQQIFKISETRQVPPPRRVPAPQTISSKTPAPTPRPTLLSRAISLLRSAAPAAKQLKLVESVSLGEKRFVAVVHADGRRFLVGGGASGVSLLAQLEESPKSTENLRSFAGPTELAG
jgi:hypothetical protein